MGNYSSSQRWGTRDEVPQNVILSLLLISVYGRPLRGLERRHVFIMLKIPSCISPFCTTWTMQFCSSAWAQMRASWLKLNPNKPQVMTVSWGKQPEERAELSSASLLEGVHLKLVIRVCNLEVITDCQLLFDYHITGVTQGLSPCKHSEKLIQMN